MMLNTSGFFINVFKNARENSVIIMDVSGNILEVNKAFRNAFGYTLKDIAGQHFRILFTDKDQQLKKPEREVKDTISEGSKSDNNYLVKKDRNLIWVMGESVLVTNSDNERYLVKVIQNIHAQKQLEHFLLESNEFLETIFDALKDTSLVVLDSALKILKTNKAFLKMFRLTNGPVPGTRFYQLDNEFCKSADIKKQLMDLLINQSPMKNVQHIYKNKAGREIRFLINSKLIEGEGREKRILLVIKND